MAERFRLRIKENLTIDLPLRLASRLRLKPGSELRLTIGDDDSLLLSVDVDEKQITDFPEDLRVELEARANRRPTPTKITEDILEKVRSQPAPVKKVRTA